MSSHSTTPEYDKRMDTLFMRLAAIYGYLWVSTYSNPNFLEVSKREWSEGLKEFDNQVLKLALEQIKGSWLFLLVCRFFMSTAPTSKKASKPVKKL